MSIGGLLIGSASFIAWCALLISFGSIYLSVRTYRKDRWKLSLEAWIQAQVCISKEGKAFTDPSPTAVRGHLFVKVASTGRRVLTIEKIWLQVFEDEIETLRKLNAPIHPNLAIIGRVEHIGLVARFPLTNPKSFPVQLGENEPLTAEMLLFGLDPSRNRFCVVCVTGRKPIKIPCWIGGSPRPKPRKFSGS